MNDAHNAHNTHFPLLSKGWAISVVLRVGTRCQKPTHIATNATMALKANAKCQSRALCASFTHRLRERRRYR